MINQQRLVQTFLDLVRIDSPSSHEAEIGRELDARLQALGLQTEMDAVGNLVGRTAEGAGNWLLLSTHMDTVGVDRGIQPVIRDGVIYSDGTTILGADDKSGVAAVLEVLTVLRQQNLPHALAQRVVAQRGHAAAAQRLLADEVEGVNAGHLVARDLALHQVRQPVFHACLGQLGAQVREPLGLARDHADVGAVALVARACPGQADQRHLDGLARGLRRTGLRLNRY